MTDRWLKALPWLLVALAVVVIAGSVLVATDPPAPATQSPAPTASPTPEVTVAPLRARVPAHLILVSKTPLTEAQRRQVVRATGAKASLLVSAGQVFMAKGHTTALGVNPDTFRAWTPKGTAESTPVWRSVARGDAAVAHVVGRAFEVPLGTPVLTQAVFPLQLRVGSFATTALPGVGAVMAEQRAQQLGMLPGTGLILSVPHREPAASAVLARRVLATGVSVQPVLYDRPISRTGWVIPVVGRLSSAFGPRVHPIRKVVAFHAGIDIAAPLGRPVYAMFDGVVLYAGPARGFGNQVVLSHRGRVTTVYGHLSQVLVTGGTVRAGQAIGRVGNEGDSTGPHLHVEVRVDDQPVDPIRWLRDRGVRL
jgi:murein DD-endopeptidase MepM/ murein hydrolase activator NlpD